MAVPRIGGGKIVSIDTLRAQAKEKRSAQGAEPTSSVNEEAATLELSPEARALLDREQTIARLKSDLVDLPDVRAEKVIEARIRLSTGFYDRPEVRAEVARAFLRENLGEDQEKP